MFMEFIQKISSVTGQLNCDELSEALIIAESIQITYDSQTNFLLTRIYQNADPCSALPYALFLFLLGT